MNVEYYCHLQQQLQIGIIWYKEWSTGINA